MSDFLTNFGHSGEEPGSAIVAVSSTPHILDSSLDLTNEQAIKLTDTIRNASEVLWVLISRAHAGKAWLALGYPTWESYVYAEFDMSRSRSYQLLDQARVIREIEAAVPAGTRITMSEAAARDLRGVLDEVIPQIKSQTEGLDAWEAEIIAQKIVDDKRNELASEKINERERAYDQVDQELESNLDYKSKEFTDFNFADDSDGPEAILKDLPNRPSSMEPYSPGAMPSGPVAPAVDVVKIRKNVNAAHDIYSSLSALAGLPKELDEVLAIIPTERYPQINDHLEKAMENLNAFADLWRRNNSADFDE